MTRLSAFPACFPDKTARVGPGAFQRCGVAMEGGSFLEGLASILKIRLKAGHEACYST